MPDEDVVEPPADDDEGHLDPLELASPAAGVLDPSIDDPPEPGEPG